MLKEKAMKFMVAYQDNGLVVFHDIIAEHPETLKSIIQINVIQQAGSTLQNWDIYGQKPKFQIIFK